MKREATIGLNLESINEFGVRMFRELPLHYLPHRFLSTPKHSPDQIQFSSSIPSEMNAACEDAEDAGCEQQQLRVESKVPLNFEIQQSGIIHGFAFWFNQVLYNREPNNNGDGDGSANFIYELNTGPSSCSGDSTALSHWRQAAVSLKTPLTVTQGQTVSVNIVMGLGVNAGVEINVV